MREKKKNYTVMTVESVRVSGGGEEKTKVEGDLLSLYLRCFDLQRLRHLSVIYTVRRVNGKMRMDGI
jgi:hypothetical protein